MLSRIKALQKYIQANQAFLLTCPTDIQYYADFHWLVPAEREAFLLLTQQHAYLLYASFSPVTKVDHIKLYAGCFPNQVVSHLNVIRKEDQFTTIFIDAEYMFVHEYQALQTIQNLEIQNLDKKYVQQQRMVKDQNELTAIKKAISITEQAYEELLPQLKKGMTEKDVQDILEASCKTHGASAMAFPTIVAFDTHTALPHHQPDDTILEENMAILLDFGAKYQDYCSDMTRTFWFGNDIPEAFTTIKNIVMQAYADALAYAQSGKPIANKIDAAAREYIETAGYGAQFIHTTGHGVGLDIHEQPSLNWKNEQILSKHTVITIEPGIYIPDQYGFRYENTIIVE